MTDGQTAMVGVLIALLCLLVIHVRREEVEALWYEHVKGRLDRYLGRE